MDALQFAPSRPLWEGLPLPKKGEVWSRLIDRARAPDARQQLQSAYPSPLAHVLAQARQKVSLISMHLEDRWRLGLLLQLEQLLDEAEWDPDYKTPSLNSFDTLLRSLLILEPIKRPGLSLSPTGMMGMSWRRDGNRLTIECLPGDKVRWALARNTPDGPERAAGETMILRLREVLAPYEPDTWFAPDADH